MERSVIFIVGTPQLWETETIQKITLYDFQINNFHFIAWIGRLADAPQIIFILSFYPQQGSGRLGCVFGVVIMLEYCPAAQTP